MHEFGIEGELNIPFSTPEEFGEIAMAWIDAGTAALAATEHEEILSGPPLNWGTQDPDSGATRFDPPGSAWGSVLVLRPPRSTPEIHLYSKRSLNRLRKLAPVMKAADIDLSRITDQGFGTWICHLDADREGDEAGIARLTVAFNTTRWPSGDVVTIDEEHPCLKLMRHFAERFNCCFGHVSFRSRNGGETALEVVLNLRPRQTLYEIDKYLRGYSWLTLLPASLTAQLGGVETLRQSGAFVTVDQLPNGSTWLLSTHRWEEYRDQRIEAVFDALAPVLPAGEPHDYYANIPEAPPILVVWQDAALRGQR